MGTKFELLSAKEISRQRLNSFPDLRYYSVRCKISDAFEPTRTHVVYIWAKDEIDAARLFYRDYK
jgi:hypothetical protein